MSISHIAHRLVDASKVAGAGRFSLTIQAGGNIDNVSAYITHWVRTGLYGHEDCRTVGYGSIADCLYALDVYARKVAAPVWTDADVARTLGIPTPSPVRPALAAE